MSQLSYLDYNPVVIHLLDRMESSGQGKIQHRSVRAINLLDIIHAPITTDSISYIDQNDWYQLLQNIPERYRHKTFDDADSINQSNGLFKTFYKSPYSFFTVDSENFFLKIDPVVHFGIGDDTESQGTIFQNTRGLKIRGTIDDKVYFYTSIFENQQRFLNYVEDEITRINAIPGQGFFKPYQSGIISGLNGWDFLNAQAYAGLKISKSIDLHLGHGRHFIGDGIRSMILSDYAHNYFYLQLNTKIWKFHYQNTFAELSAQSSRDNTGNQLLPKKYMAAHYLDFSVNSRFSIGLYEAVIFSRQNNFEFQYLNPIILYRSVEQFLDSPDNAVLGLNVKWIPKYKWQLYGQLLIDELRTDQAFTGKGWWGNKIGYQIGLKKFDLFNVENFDFQIEYNTARPYTYAHRDDQSQTTSTTSYAHYNQALAHPYGANFRETIIHFKYRPDRNISLQTFLLFSKYGDDPIKNIGRNILSNYEDRSSDFGNFTGQGISNNITALHFSASWQFFPNYFLDLQYINRNQTISDSPSKKTNYFGFGIRANVFSNPLLF